MINVRPIVVDEEMVVLGGNMRLKAIKEIGIEEVEIMKVEGWSEEKKKEFIVKDNVSAPLWNIPPAIAPSIVTCLISSLLRLLTMAQADTSSPIACI